MNFFDLDVPARLISANNEIETIPGESFELKIDVLDKCDNIVDSFNGEAQLVLNEIAESYALLNGSSKTKLQNGQAVFQLSASMNTKCPTGVYPIEISLVGIQLAPVIVSLRFENGIHVKNENIFPSLFFFFFIFIFSIFE